MRFAVDTGGTFTDLVVEDERRTLRAVQGADDARRSGRRGCSTCSSVAADGAASTARELLGAARAVHPRHDARDSTRSSPATTARTAFLTTEGHPDILLFREGGRTEPFDFTRRVPRAVRAARADLRGRRSGSAPTARSCRPLDEDARASRSIARLRERERRGGRRSACCGRSSTRRTSCASASCSTEHLPGVPFTLSHQLNPSAARVPPRLLDLHRRVAEAGDDATTSRELERRLREAGFGGRVLIVTSAGGVLDAGGRRRGADPLDQLRARRWRRSPAATSPRSTPTARHGDRRRHRRHELRRQPRAPRPHPVDARDLARRAVLRAT